MQAAAQQTRGSMSAILGLDAGAVRAVLSELDAPAARETRELQLSDADRHQRRTRRGRERGPSDARRRRETRRAAQRFGCVAQLADAAGDRAAANRGQSAHAFRCRFSTSFRTSMGSHIATSPTIEANLVRSVVDEVRWHATAERLLTYRLDAVVEFGASGVLGALMKRMPGCADDAGRERLRGPRELAPCASRAVAEASV